MTLPAALCAAKASGVAIRHVDWVPGRTLVVDSDELIDRGAPTPVWNDGEIQMKRFGDDYQPTYSEAVSDGWAAVK